MEADAWTKLPIYSSVGLVAANDQQKLLHS